jgi:amino acid adenylation domain-containing protein
MTAFHSTIHELVASWAARTPHAKAVVCNGAALTYTELHARAERLAVSLRNAGVMRETTVGLCVDRSIEMIIGMLAILKAGGAYVPLSPALPAERLSFMLQDSGTQVLLAPARLRDVVPLTTQRLLLIDSEETTAVEQAHDDAVDSSLAYVIYTSGSTGQPKGVEVEHASAINLLTTVPALLGASAGDVWTVYHSYAFDLSVWEIWSPLTSGGTLVIVPDEVTRSPRAFADLLRRERVTVLSQTPSALVQLVTALDSIELNALPVRVLICGGDAFPAAQLPRLREWQVNLWNFYGPTEATVWAAIHRLDLQGAAATLSVPLGEAIPNTRIHVLDEALRPVTTGAQGEIYIGGAAVARGYRNRPQLTAERFVVCNGERMYRTGDLARVEADGAIRFLGRADHQIKLRGFRVELGEIEAQLNAHPAVREATVCVCEQPDQTRHLVAFFVPSSEPAAATFDSLRKHLDSRLPQYMIPASFVRLERLPLTNSGKVDRAMLTALASAQTLARQERVSPQTPTERKLLHIWERSLSARPIGTTDNFFDLGGDSLSAMSVAAQIEREFGCEIAPELFFQRPTIAGLAPAIDALRADAGWHRKALHTLVSAVLSPVRGMQRLNQAMSSSRKRIGDEVQEVRDLLQCLGARSALVEIQNSRSQRPVLFCVPGVVGSVLYLYDLARSMGPDQAFYGLQARGLDGKSEPLTQVEDMARYCIEAIKAVQKNGPYFLAGHSNGSHIALEIALQLEAAGDEVALIAVLDEIAPMPGSYYEDGYWDDARILTYLARLIQDWTKVELGIDYPLMASLAPDAQWALLMKWMRKVNVALPMIGKAQIRGMLRTLKAGLLAQYVPARKVRAQVSVFRTAQTHHDETTTPRYIELREHADLCWTPHAERVVHVCNLPGDHVTLLSQPHVTELAQAIRLAMDEVMHSPARVNVRATAPHPDDEPMGLKQCA